MSQFAEKRAWFITGCSTGFGRKLTESVLASGERVVATLRKPADIASLAERYSKDQLLVLKVDVTSYEDIDDAFNVVKKTFGRLDVVVNNAGYGLIGEAEGVEEKTARTLIEVLFWGAVYVTKQAVQFFREVNPKGHGGRILQISSMGGFITFPLNGYYHAGKFAFEGFTESMSQELPPEWNIKMTIIEPGGFPTDFASRSLNWSPLHHAYANSPTSNHLRKLILEDKSLYKGDIAKAVQAMIKVVDMEDPPLRLPLGADAVAVIKEECKKVLAEVEKYEHIGLNCMVDEAK